MSKKCRIVIAMVLTLVLQATAAFAQADRGSIQGRVTDSTSAVLQGASVTVTPGGMRAATNTEGEYTITGLAPRSYTVTVRFPGLKEFTRTGTAGPGQTTRGRRTSWRRSRSTRRSRPTWTPTASAAA